MKSNLVNQMYFKPMPELSERDVRRFRSKIFKRALDQCWPWRKRVNEDGYGMFDVTDGSALIASRVAYFLATGIDPENSFVCHTCDHPRCCNPRHLILGTSKFNVNDSVIKGRHSSITLAGESRPNSKLTEVEVKEIRLKRAAFGFTYDMLAKDYHVDFTTIAQVVNRKTWRHIP